MLAIALALGSSLLWGLADFSGGLITRRLSLAAVTLLSQFVGLTVLVVAVGLDGWQLDGRAVALGALAGLGGGFGIAAFYRGLALGTMSIVAPIAACGALIPVGLALAGGERPSALALAGIGLGITGSVLASVEEHASGQAHRRRGVLLALAAAVAFGLFFFFLGRASEDGETLSALLGVRLGSVSVLGAGALLLRGSLRVSGRDFVAISLIGLADTAANGLFALAASHGLLSIVSVLGSLYPVVIVLLAHVALGERISRLQQGAVAVAFAGVALVSA